MEIDYAVTASGGLTNNVIIRNGMPITYGYDLRRTLVQVTPNCSDTPGCQKRQVIDYDGNFQTTLTQDANGNTTTQSWNSTGSNQEHMIDTLGHQTNIVYNEDNNFTQIGNARGFTTTYAYSSTTQSAFLTSMTDALGKTTIYTPTTVAADGIDGLLKAEQDPTGRITTYQYNEFGQVTQVIQAAGTAEALTTTYGYDDLGRLITTTQQSLAENHTTLKAYDDGDRHIATIENWQRQPGDTYNDWPTYCIIPATHLDQDICTRYGYDEAGRTVSTTNALDQTSLTFYDQAGHVVTSVINYDGQTALNTLCTDFTHPNPEFNICSLTGYDQYGRVVTTTNSLGYQTVTHYNNMGRVSSTIANWDDGVFDANNPDTDIVTHYGHDAVGNTIFLTDTLNHTTHMFYDELNQLVGIIDNWQPGTMLSNCFDGSLSSERDNNVCTLYQYNEIGNAVIVTDTLGRMTHTFYDALNQIEGTITNWQSGTTLADCFSPSRPTHRDYDVCILYHYDATGRQTKITNPLNQTNLTVYDEVGRPVIQVTNWDGITTIQPDGTGCANTATNPEAVDNLCTKTVYDSLGRPASTTDVMGQVITFTYDSLSRLITTTRILDGENVTTGTRYDALGNRLSQQNEAGHTTQFIYDSLNRPLITISPLGQVITQAYNAASWVLTTTDHLDHQTIAAYDDLGHLIAVTDAENNQTQYKYDALGNQVAMIDAENVQTTYVYDGLNRLVQVIENDVTGQNPTHEQDILTQYHYDVLGNRLVITNGRNLTTSLTLYDGLNRPILTADGLGHTHQYQYNVLGSRTVMTDALGAVTLYSYDALNRPQQITYTADSEIVSYSYNAAGNRLTMVDRLGTTFYGYDDFYRLISVTNPFNQDVLYRYDKVGNHTGLTYPDGKVVTYTYNADNQLTAVTDWQENTTTYAYDKVGQLDLTTLPNNVSTQYAYDKVGRLVDIHHYQTDSGDLMAQFSYELDGVGNRLTATEKIQLPVTGTASLPIGVVDVPLNAVDIIASIQPPNPLDVWHKRHLTKQTPVPPSPPLPDPLLGSVKPIGDEMPPFDPKEVAERARNQIRVDASGRPIITRTYHAATFNLDGEVTFVPIITPTQPLTRTQPMTLHTELAGITIGTNQWPLSTEPISLSVNENKLQWQRGTDLTELFIALDAGIEQQWQIDQLPPGWQGDVRVTMTATTNLTATISGEGFRFHALTSEGVTAPVMQYGRAVAIDATGSRQWAALSLVHQGTTPDGLNQYQLQMTFPGTWITQAQTPILIDPLISNLMRLGHDAPSGDQQEVQIVYNPDDDEYLVVWQDYRSGTDWDIYGQRISSDGGLLGDNFAIADKADDESKPQVSYGGGEYLVTWRYDVTSDNHDVYGQLIDGDGSLLGSTLSIATTSGTNEKEVPTDIVYNNTADKFLVLWKDREGSSRWNTWARHVADTGTMDSEFRVTSAAISDAEANAVGAYNADNDQYLVVWEQWTTTTDKDIEGYTVSGGGTVTTTLIPVASGTANQHTADVVYLTETGQYVVVWQDDRNAAVNSYDIYGQRVSPDGSLNGSNGIISDEAASEASPRLTLDGAGGAQVIWQQTNAQTGDDLYALSLDSNGQPTGSTLTIIVIDDAQALPALAGDGSDNYLIAWQDARNGNEDIYARTLRSDALLGENLMVHPAPGDQKEPEAAYNPDDDEYLVVWQDYRSGSDWDVYGQKVSGDGALIGDNLTISDANKDQLYPQVVYGGQAYFIVWQHEPDSLSTGDTDVMGQIISRTGQVVSSSIAIATTSGTSEKETPTDLVYNPTANKFLVLWQYLDNGDWDTWGRHVATTAAADEAFSIAATTSQDDTGAVGAYNASNDQYLIVWEQEHTTAEGVLTIKGRRMTGSGTVTTTETIDIATSSTADRSAPDIVYLAASQQYVTVWQNATTGSSNYDVYSRLVSPGGEAIGNATIITATTKDEQYPRLAPDGNEGVMIIWQHDNEGTAGYDLYGRLLGQDGLTYDDTFTVLETSANQEQPVIANDNGSRYLLAWQDDREGGWDLYAALFQPIQATHIVYTYDPLYRLTNATYSGGLNVTYDYLYDAVGNMTAYTETTASLTAVVTRTFDAVNRLQNSGDGSGLTTYTYDANGNLIESDAPGSSNDVRYGYNQRHLLITHTRYVESTGWVAQAEFAYDGSSNRLRQVDYTGSTPITTTYTNHIIGLSQSLVSDDGTTQTHTLFGHDLISQDNGNEIRYHLADGLGSVRVELVGDVIETTTTYSPYGSVLLQAGNSGTVYGFTGEQYDKATDLLYLRARYYNPTLHTFMGKDPWNGNPARPQSMNGWNYVENNPINLTDPTGMFPKFCKSLNKDWQYAVCVSVFYGVKPAWKLIREGRLDDYSYNINSNESGILGSTGCFYGAVPYKAPGYLEGVSGQVTNDKGAFWSTVGGEIVYDFATFQRVPFLYKDGNPSYGGIVSDSLYGVSYSESIGMINGFRSWTNISEYEGIFIVTSFGLGTNFIGDLGVNLGRSEFFGFPDTSINGTSSSVSLGASLIDILPIAEFAVSNIDYKMFGAPQSYVRQDTRSVDIALLRQHIWQHHASPWQLNLPLHPLVRFIPSPVTIEPFIKIPPVEGMINKYSRVYEELHFKSGAP